MAHDLIHDEEWILEDHRRWRIEYDVPRGSQQPRSGHTVLQQFNRQTFDRSALVAFLAHPGLSLSLLRSQ
ncbi:hypothetical protein [Natrinema halophilum]|uniref:Uncharacterized protein n=1 Tax=Natrinema halophilum TaxID=1699371 RepID=A0A7D5KE71_9EURY|nr:hypothetical protein [Natrinema halophilum]QLG49956.1 hypothetical protein HYG82_14390 [Natrinema halophilum]